jgi:Holliday junction resolvasome RuvABC endonuclease subunit
MVLPARPTILGLDMGFAGLGWSVTELGHTEPGDRVLELGVIVTKITPKKRRAFVSDDNVRRTAEIYVALRALVDRHRIRMVCAESFVYHRGIKASAKMGLAWGAMIALTTERDLPLLEASPQDVKKVLTGKATATKTEVQEAVLARYKGRIDLAGLTDVSESLYEHPFDSVGATVACLPSNTVKLLRAA